MVQENWGKWGKAFKMPVLPMSKPRTEQAMNRIGISHEWTAAVLTILPVTEHHQERTSDDLQQWKTSHVNMHRVLFSSCSSFSLVPNPEPHIACSQALHRKVQCEFSERKMPFPQTWQPSFARPSSTGTATAMNVGCVSHDSNTTILFSPRVFWLFEKLFSSSANSTSQADTTLHAVNKYLKSDFPSGVQLLLVENNTQHQYPLPLNWLCLGLS